MNCEWVIRAPYERNWWNYGSRNVYNEIDEIMVLEMYMCYIWFHEIMYSCICAPYCICCMCFMWAQNDGIIVIICAYITQSFTPWQYRVTIWIHMGSVSTTPKVWAIGRGGLHLGKFLTCRLFPVTTGWAFRSFKIGLFGCAKRNVRRSRLNSGGGPVEVKTYTLHKWFMHHSVFDLIVCHLTDSLLAKLFELFFLEFLKNIILLFVVLSLLSCQTHQFSL